MENQQQLPTIEEVDALKIDQEIEIRTIQPMKFLIFYYWIIPILGGAIFYDEIFAESDLLGHFLNYYLFYMFIFLFSLILGLGFIKFLERFFEKQIKKMMLRGEIILIVVSILLLIIIPVGLTRSIFLYYFFHPLYLDVLLMSFVYFIFGIITYLAWQVSSFSESFDNLKEVLEKIVKYIEGDDFIVKVKGIENDFTSGINEFNSVLKRDNIRLKLDFARNYIYMLKCFGTKGEWKDFTLTLFNILKEYEDFNIPKIVSIFASCKEKFKDLENRIDIAEVHPAFFQKISLFIRERLMEIVMGGFGGIASAIFYILRFMVIG